jgi:thiol-disulfide isomerase/thioredoxin/outer membrane lipoprotein-sorting protein
MAVNTTLNAKSKLEATNAEEILKKVYNRLNSLKSITYDYNQEVNYKSESISNQLSGKVTIDFGNPDALIGFKYYIENDNSKLVYNGTEQFALNKKEKTIEITDNPSLKNFKNISFFYNSILTLKKSLPLIIADNGIAKSASDTIFNSVSYSLVKFTLSNKVLGRLGTIEPLSTDRDITYKVVIEKSTYLPHGIIWSNNVNSDYTKTDFRNISVNTLDIADTLWFYSTYLNEFNPIKREKLQLIQVGEIVPSLKLFALNSGDPKISNAVQGKLVLLEFWIKNCGYCISAVPKLNALKQKYKDKQFEIISINTADSKEEIDLFTKKHNVEFAVISDGKQFAKKFGVGAFPTAILLDKKGKVVYTGTVDTQNIEKLIENNL